MLRSFIKAAVKLEPVFAAGTVQAVLALVVALGFHLSAGTTGAIEAVAAAVLALVVAANVDKVTPVLYTGLLTALGTLVYSLGVHGVTSARVSAVNALLTIVLTTMLREKVTPVHKAAPARAAGK